MCKHKQSSHASNAGEWLLSRHPPEFEWGVAVGPLCRHAWNKLLHPVMYKNIKDKNTFQRLWLFRNRNICIKLKQNYGDDISSFLCYEPRPVKFLEPMTPPVFKPGPTTSPVFKPDWRAWQSWCICSTRQRFKSRLRYQCACLSTVNSRETKITFGRNRLLKTELSVLWLAIIFMWPMAIIIINASGRWIVGPTYRERWLAVIYV